MLEKMWMKEKVCMYKCCVGDFLIPLSLSFFSFENSLSCRRWSKRWTHNLLLLQTLTILARCNTGREKIVTQNKGINWRVVCVGRRFLLLLLLIHFSQSQFRWERENSIVHLPVSFIEQSGEWAMRDRLTIRWMTILSVSLVNEGWMERGPSSSIINWQLVNTLGKETHLPILTVFLIVEIGLKS